MRRLLLALGLALSLCAGAQAQPSIIGPPNAIQCNKAAFATTAAGTVSVVAGVAGQTIHICGWHVTSILSTTSTFTLEYGTQGGPCTTPTAITAALNVTSTAPSVDHMQFAVLDVPAGAQVCLLAGTGATGTAIVLWYAQF